MEMKAEAAHVSMEITQSTVHSANLLQESRGKGSQSRHRGRWPAQPQALRTPSRENEG
jgi:hypothetical protein